MNPKRGKYINVNEDGADSVMESWLQDVLNDNSDDEQVAGQSCSVMHSKEDIHNSDNEDGEYILSEHDTDTDHSDKEQPSEAKEAAIEDGESSSSESNLPILELSRRLRNSDNVPAQDNSSDMSDENQSTPAQRRDQNYYYGKDRFKWSRLPPARNVRTAAHNVVQVPRIRPATEGPLTPIDAFQLIYDQSMHNTILIWTNKKLEEFQRKYPKDSAFRETNSVELKGFLALLIYSAIFKSNRESILSLFATDGTGREIFRASMAKNRFAALLLALRFDDASDRETRRQVDPACLITDILQAFVENSQKNYSMGTNVTVDEMLIEFRGRSRFKMYMPNKPGKYGLKMQCLVDSETFYVYNIYLYTGKGSDGLGLTEEEKKKSVPTQATLRLCKPIFNTNINVTTDNWYSSMELLQELEAKGLTTVGTLKKNKRVIPKEFLPHKARPVESSVFGFTKKCTLVSYVPKKNKSVVLYSSMHHDNTIDDVTGKPEIIMYYNSTKGGVDVVDQKCSVYSCSRRTTRWPMAVFFRIIDMACCNAQVIYESQSDVSKLKRLDFLKIIAENLNESNLLTRLHSTRLPRQVRCSISSIMKKDIPEDASHPDTDDSLPRNERKYCYLCHYKKRTKTAFLCTKCLKPICLTCSKKICRRCL